jgi:hypothetical protein
MLRIPDQTDSLARLTQRVRLADEPSSTLIDSIITEACPRAAGLRSRGQARALEAALAAGAWTDATLALIDLELPGWTMRRLIRDDGAWLCSLSRSPNLPIELDDGAEATHEVLSLAIIAAMLEARRAGAAVTIRSTSVPTTLPSNGQRMCCDNFSR